LPLDLYEEINSFIADCPLCEVFYREDCLGCPRYDTNNGSFCAGANEVYTRWRYAKEEKTRAESAREIVAKVRAWDV
jgi:hypothetical protein